MNRFDIQRRPSFSGGPLLPSICAANHPRTYVRHLLIFASLPTLFGRVSAV
jgi:hypothetical protein